MESLQLLDPPEKPMLTSYSAAFRHFVNQLHLPWRKTQRENFIRLGAAFLQRRSLPVGRLARTLAGPTPQVKAADKRLRRFLGNDRLALDAALGAYLRLLLPRCGAVPFIPVMLDWTYVKERAILSAKIPYRGRSFPLFETVHERCIERRVYSQTQAEIALLRRLGWQWPPDAPPPLLLADRGFDKSRLLEWLIHGPASGSKRPAAPGSHPWRFLIRSCLQSAVTDAHGRRLEKRLRVYPGETLTYRNVTYHLEQQFQLHLVATCVRHPKTGEPAPWYLITNLPEDQLRRAPRLYAQRMQPEETYRDNKRGYLLSGFGLHALAGMRRDRLERYLILLGFLYGFLVLVAETEAATRAWLARRRWKLSLISFAFELLQAAPRQALRRARQACASRQLQPLWFVKGDP
jgi:hypothetical protein